MEFPKTPGQCKYMLSLRSQKPIVIGTGPAGTGKTMIDSWSFDTTSPLALMKNGSIGFVMGQSQSFRFAMVLTVDMSFLLFNIDFKKIA